MGAYPQLQDATLHLLALVQHELLLFALAGLLIGGLDDLVFDLIFLGRTLWRRFFIYRRYPRMSMADLPPSQTPGRLAIFVPAWDEGEVIGPMLRRICSLWQGQDYRLFAGIYPNDAKGLAAAAAQARHAPQMRLVLVPHDGPTTKADCLNHLWRAMRREEEADGVAYKGVVLHDAEDVVHEDELRLFDTMLDRFGMVQLPVRPLLSQQSLWVAGHYADEFAESHGKILRTREALGAAIPSAGVGCAFQRQALAQLAQEREGNPFDASSLTEDYEAGLRLRERGWRGAFVTLLDANGQPVCTREHFPETLRDAVKQKSRWFAGIALAGWDRLGWGQGWHERWMRLHDRRALLAAVTLFAAYGATLLYGVLFVGRLLGIGDGTILLGPVAEAGLLIGTLLMIWRMGMRAFFSASAYGWRQGLLAIPRCIVANIITMMAARRAVALYWRQMRQGKVVWDKTTHRFPSTDMSSASVGGPR